MNDQTLKIVSAAVSDRGLSDKRPLNEDSFLADVERHIFAVADGVGGAQAGEVASQTAVEVLDEAFRHQDASVDVEDLMELAIQRANASIHRMAQEHPKLQMMATTIVALHLDGHIATIGHVGDSRLYRVTPGGRIHRDTSDHSVVEEEVRAGRMTAAQAAHHPSRNVISRALGADEGVEVDMKTIEVDEGTTFLLCSDGITRHIPDDELLSLLYSEQEPDVTCAEMKRICYERGAEDNLTAVIVRVGTLVTTAAGDALDPERTVSPDRHSLAATMGGGAVVDDPSLHETVDALAPLPSGRLERDVDVRLKEPSPEPTKIETVQPVGSTPAKGSSFGTFARTLLFLILLLGIAAAAFFGGIYKQRRDSQAEAERNAATPNPSPSPAAPDFSRKRDEVDAAPAKLANRMAKEQDGNPMASSDPQFLYLYGRALLLSGAYADASVAFNHAAELLKTRPARDPLRIETRIAAAASAMRSVNASEREKAIKGLDEVTDPDGKALVSGSGSNKGKKFPIGANSSVSPPVELPH